MTDSMATVNIYRQGKTMKLGEALDHLLAGRSVFRDSWDYYDRLVYVPGSRFPVTEDRPAGQAMPDLLGREVTYEPHIDVIRHDLHMRAWTPTQADLLADDWVLFQPDSIRE